MKKFIIILPLLLLVPVLLSGQSTNPLTSKCAMNAGTGTTFVKDFVVKLGKGANLPELRTPYIFPLSKNIKYRFTLCNADNSTAQLIMKIKDGEGKQILSSYDSKTGKSFASIDFLCNKTGTYKLFFDFRDFEKGEGVGIVSVVSGLK